MAKDTVVHAAHIYHAERIGWCTGAGPRPCFSGPGPRMGVCVCLGGGGGRV